VKPGAQDRGMCRPAGKEDPEGGGWARHKEGELLRVEPPPPPPDTRATETLPEAARITGRGTGPVVSRRPEAVHPIRRIERRKRAQTQASPEHEMRAESSPSEPPTIPMTNSSQPEQFHPRHTGRERRQIDVFGHLSECGRGSLNSRMRSGAGRLRE